MLSYGRALTRLASLDPVRPAVIDRRETVTRSELDAQTNVLAREYAARGVTADSIVSILLANGADLIRACLATWKLGATPQVLSARMPASELDAILALSAPTLVVRSDNSSGAAVSDLRAAPSLSDAPLPDAVSTSWKAPTSGGSTGVPKVIVSTQPALIDPRTPADFGMQLDGRQLVVAPMYHNAPFVVAILGLLTGNTLYLHERFDAAETLASIERERITWMMLVPTMMSRILRLPEADRSHDISSLTGILHVGGPCAPWVKRAWLDWLGPEKVFELYGGTESQGVTIISGPEWLAHEGSVGRPGGHATSAGVSNSAGGVRMEIRGETGTEVPAGEIGEIWIHMDPERPTYRYLGNADPRRDDDWETLGDLGWMDDDGYLYIADRRTDLIVSGGANIYPAEVEAALLQHPSVRDCVVIGLPDDDLGRVAHAIVDEATPVSDDDLRAHLGVLLTRYKIPRSFERSTGSFRSESGKVRRSALVAQRMTNQDARRL